MSFLRVYGLIYFDICSYASVASLRTEIKINIPILYVMFASFLKMLISACGRCFFREQVHTCVMLRN